MPTPPPGARVRAATPADLEPLAHALTRAFADDPSMRWFSGARPGLAHFQLVLVKMCFATGFVTVVTVPAKDGEGEGAGERIVGGALWLQPGQKMEPSLTTFVRISPWKAIWSWGLSALSRLFLKYTPTIEKTLDKAFGARGVDRLDSWHLFEIAVDPDWEGQGLCSLLVRDGFARATPKPIHLEATTPKSRDRYLHFGFEIDEEHRFGVGEVDEKGLPAKGEAAVGWPDVVMTKWAT